MHHTGRRVAAVSLDVSDEIPERAAGTEAAVIGTTTAGIVADRFGDVAVFSFLGSVGAAGLLLGLALMPETRGSPG